MSIRSLSPSLSEAISIGVPSELESVMTVTPFEMIRRLPTRAEICELGGRVVSDEVERNEVLAVVEIFIAGPVET